MEVLLWYIEYTKNIDYLIILLKFLDLVDFIDFFEAITGVTGCFLSPVKPNIPAAAFIGFIEDMVTDCDLLL